MTFLVAFDINIMGRKKKSTKLSTAVPSKISTLGNKVIGKFYFLPVVIYDI